MVLTAILLQACGAQPEDDPVVRVIGGPGRDDGRFVTPRALAVVGDRVWVVDRSGRVQAFDLDGTYRLQIPVVSGARGFPVGLAGSPDGGFLLLDTHNSLLRRFDADGAEFGQSGGPGKQPGRFSYPQRAARDARGRWHITEYGEGDSNRVQILDDGLLPVQTYGTYGTEPGHFTRAIGITVAGDEVFIADASDRIIVYGTNGTFRREFGRTGSGSGELRYPYGLCVSRGLIHVAEYGNHRIQRFTPAGEPRGCYGRAGRGAGRFSGPWDIAAAPDGTLVVCDTGNHRLVVLDPDRVPWRDP